MAKKALPVKEDLQGIIRRLNPNIPAGQADGMPRVARDATAIRQLATLFAADPNAKALLTGHIGVGKSTELQHLANSFASERLVIQCSVVDSLGIQNVNTFSLLVVVLEATIRKWRSTLSDFPKGLVTELVDHIRRLFPESKRPPARQSPLHDALFSQIEAFQAAMKTLPTRITTVDELHRLYSDCIQRLALRYVPDNEASDPTDMAASCEILIKEFAHKSGLSVLLIIDDLDKIRDPSVQSSVFIDRAMAWKRLPCGLVATLPYDSVFSTRSAELDSVWGDVLVLDPLAIPETTGDLNEAALKPYLTMLRDAGAHTAISALQCRRLAIASSGIARAFVHACSSCILYALQAEKTHVLDYHVDQVLGDIVNKWRARLSDDDYKVLLRVLDSRGANVPAGANLVRDGVLIRNTTLPPDKQITLAGWAVPLVEAFRRHQNTVK